MSFPNVVYGSEEETFAADAIQSVPVGTKMIIEDGRAYRYAKNNASNAAIVANVQQGAIPEVAKYGDQAVATLAAGVSVLTAVGATTTDMGIHELVNGYCWSEQTTQLGPASRIKDNTLIAAGAATGTITLYSPLPLALVAADTISYIRNPWMNVLIQPTTPTGQLVGIAVAAIPVSTWGWVQVSGPCKVQTTGTPLIADSLVISTATAGCVMPSVAFETDGPAVGRFLSWEQANEDALIFACIE